LQLIHLFYIRETFIAPAGGGIVVSRDSEGQISIFVSSITIPEVFAR